LFSCSVKSRVILNNVGAIELHLLRVSLADGPLTDITPNISLLGPKIGAAMEDVSQSLSPSLKANPLVKYLFNSRSSRLRSVIVRSVNRSKRRLKRFFCLFESK
jgi:hypothetical protein